MHLKGILVTIVILHLSGCASYIAKKVTSMPDNQVTGNVATMAEASKFIQWT